MAIRGLLRGQGRLIQDSGLVRLVVLGLQMAYRTLKGLSSLGHHDSGTQLGHGSGEIRVGEPAGEAAGLSFILRIDFPLKSKRST